MCPILLLNIVEQNNTLFCPPKAIVNVQVYFCIFFFKFYFIFLVLDYFCIC